MAASKMRAMPEVINDPNVEQIFSISVISLSACSALSEGGTQEKKKGGGGGGGQRASAMMS